MATALTQRQLDQAVDTYLMPREADHVCELCKEPFEIGETGISDDDHGICFDCLISEVEKNLPDMDQSLCRNNDSLTKEKRKILAEYLRLLADAVLG